MATEMDPDVAQTELLPMVLEMASDTVSQRVSFGLVGRNLLIESPDRLWRYKLVFDSLCKQVPNIRFNVAKELGTIAPVCGQTVYETQVSPVLSVLLDDTDQDVRYFAEQTSKKLEQGFSGAGK